MRMLETANAFGVFYPQTDHGRAGTTSSWVTPVKIQRGYLNAKAERLGLHTEPGEQAVKFGG